jgi:FkbM family methyltransferase
VTLRPYFYLGDDRGLTQLSGGLPFYVYTKDRSITPWILLGGIWETFVDDILCALARPGDVFLDIGANQGYYTVKIGAQVGPSGKVFSFEPNPQMYSFLADNIEINALSARTTSVRAAAGAEAGRADMAVTPHYPGGAHVLLGEAGQGAAGTIEIDVVRVDDVVPADVRADLIKIDVEGFEPLVLQGMRSLLARSPDCPIVCEVGVDQWARICDPAQALREFAGDRRIFRIQHDGLLDELTDDIVAALDPSFVSYVLLLPRSEERYAQISRFVRPGEAAEEFAETGADEPDER